MTTHAKAHEYKGGRLRPDYALHANGVIESTPRGTRTPRAFPARGVCQVCGRPKAQHYA